MLKPPEHVDALASTSPPPPSSLPSSPPLLPCPSPLRPSEGAVSLSTKRARRTFTLETDGRPPPPPPSPSSSLSTYRSSSSVGVVTSLADEDAPSTPPSLPPPPSVAGRYRPDQGPPGPDGVQPDVGRAHQSRRPVALDRDASRGPSLPHPPPLFPLSSMPRTHSDPKQSLTESERAPTPLSELAAAVSHARVR